MGGTSMSRRRFIELGRGTTAFVLAAAAAPAAVSAQGNEKAAGAVHGLEVSVGAGLRSETWLNDILLARTEAGQTSVAALAIQHDMVPGENIAEVRIGLAGMALQQSPAPIPGTPPPAITAQLLLQIDEPRRVGDTLEVITRNIDQVVWAPTPGGNPILLPHRLALTFAPPSPVVAPPWAEATRNVSESTAEAVYTRIAELAKMLREGSLDAYLSAGTVRREHMARSYPLGPNAEATRAQDLQDLEAMRSEPGFTVSLPPRSEAQFRTMAGGRLMDWTNASGEPALTIASRGVPPSPVRMQFSLIDGKLVMTR